MATTVAKIFHAVNGFISTTFANIAIQIVEVHLNNFYKKSGGALFKIAN